MAQAHHHRDHHINKALQSGIEQMKSHADVMKKAGAAGDAIAKHRQLQQKHAAARGGGNAAAPQQGAKKARTHKRVTKQGV